MEKKLPSVFANKIEKKLENNNYVSVSKNENRFVKEEKSVNVQKKIKDIFSSPKYVYRTSVLITLKDKKVTKKIIGKNNNNLVTLDNELIPISEIVDIEQL